MAMATQTTVHMRPHACSPQMNELAQALAPMVRKMLRDPNVVFTRPPCLDNAELPTYVPKLRKSPLQVALTDAE